MNVGREERRPDAVADGLAGPDEIEQVMGGDVRDDQRQRGSREDPPGTPQVETRQRDRPPLGELGQEDAGDQKAGENEKDVDADEATREERHARVPENHKQNRHSSQTLDVVSVRHPASLSSTTRLLSDAIRGPLTIL
jgi:hypothetical protein